MAELVILVGLPGAGKSTFYRQRFEATHVLVSKDLLKSHRRPADRQGELIAEALAQGRNVVLDNTNAGLAERAPVIALARAAGARVVAYYFDCPPKDCLARNQQREGVAKVPNIAIFTTAKRLVRPLRAEGFDEIHRVRVVGDMQFEVTRAED
jgi:predicted kinase